MSCFSRPCSKCTRRRARREAGLSLIEIVIALAAFTTLLVVSMQTITGLTESQAYVEGKARTRALAERIVELVREDVLYSTRLFQHRSASYALIEKMALPDMPLTDSRLPTSSAIGYFAPDPAGVIETGNLLFLLRTEPTIIADLDAVVPGMLWRVSTYRFVLYYLTGDEEYDLHRWASTVVADHHDIVRLTNQGQRHALVEVLLQQGIDFAWDSRAAPAASMYTLAIDEDPAPLTPETKVSMDQKFSAPSLVGARDCRIAANGTPAPLFVPSYARPTTYFPQGFEVKVDGNAIGGLLMVRIGLQQSIGNRTHGITATRQQSYRDQ